MPVAIRKALYSRKLVFEDVVAGSPEVTQVPPGLPTCYPYIMKKSLKIVTALFAIIGLIFVIALVVVLLLIHDHKNHLIISGSAMSPTLNNGQSVKITPYPSGKTPQPGDIVEFKETSVVGNKDAQYLVKRIVGLPGDRVVISNGQLTIYNAQHPKGYEPDSLYLKGNTTTAGNIDITLSTEQYFVLGDNRSDSLDSRVFGPINLQQVIAKVDQ